MNIPRLIKLAAALDFHGCHVRFFQPNPTTPDAPWGVDVAQPDQWGENSAAHKCYGTSPEDAAAKVEAALVEKLRKHMASADSEARHRRAQLEALLSNPQEKP